ncbi:MAG: YihY/virulence factor BrkB family protein [Bacteroidales bacterium]|jgi:membrane protein|nr:YihY/virulence factor BrkB family protein [Bacteroidales bacterium]
MNDLLKEIRSFYKWLVKFLTFDIWHINLEDFGKAKRNLIRYIKVAIVTVKETKTVRLGMFAVNLSYFSGMAIIPFAAVALVLTKGVGIENVLQSLLMKAFSGNQEVIKYVLHYADNIIIYSRKGLFGVISFITLLWFVMALMMNVEKSFNRIWKAERRRPLGKRVLYYFGILLVAPFIVLIFLTLFVSFLTSGLALLGINRETGKVVQWLIFYGMIVLAFTGMFKYIPNVDVHFSAAFNSALITAFAFTVLQYLYIGTQIMVSKMNAVYGAFAAIPLFLIWNNIGWTIILIGAEISHAFQYVKERKEDLCLQNKITSK